MYNDDKLDQLFEHNPSRSSPIQQKQSNVEGNAKSGVKLHEVGSHVNEYSQVHPTHFNNDSTESHARKLISDPSIIDLGQTGIVIETSSEMSRNYVDSRNNNYKQN